MTVNAPQAKYNSPYGKVLAALGLWVGLMMFVMAAVSLRQFMTPAAVSAAQEDSAGPSAPVTPMIQFVPAPTPAVSVKPVETARPAPAADAATTAVPRPSANSGRASKPTLRSAISPVAQPGT